MKGTISQTLKALAGLDSGACHDLRLAADLYPETAMQRITDSFSRRCRISCRREGRDLWLTIEALDSSEAGRALIGEFLNRLLAEALAHRSRQA